MEWKHRLLALALSGTVACGAALGAAAAESDGYGISMDDSTLRFTNLASGAESAYTLEGERLRLYGQDKNIVASFTDGEGRTRHISLGEQKSLELDGALSEVVLDESLPTGVYVGISASIENLTVNAASGRVFIDGNVLRAMVNGGAKVRIGSDASILNVLALSRGVCIQVDSGARVASAYAVSGTSIVGVSPSFVKKAATPAGVSPSTGKSHRRPTLGSSVTLGSTQQ